MAYYATGNPYVIRPDCHHHFDASGTSNAMFDELAERSLMSPLAGTKHTYLTYPFRKKCLFPKMPKYHPKFNTKPPNSG